MNEFRQFVHSQIWTFVNPLRKKNLTPFFFIGLMGWKSIRVITAMGAKCIVFRGVVDVRFGVEVWGKG